MEKNLPIKKVIFSVGIAHPLYNKSVDAYIESENCGYDRRRIYAHTVEPVHYPEDPQGLLVYKGDKFIGYKTKPAYSEVWQGYVDKIVK